MKLSTDFLKEYAAQPMELFVETGTGLGETLAKASCVFERCKSVELREDLKDFLVGKFKRIGNVILRGGKSVDMIRSIKGDLSTTFWLDAHYGGKGPKPEKECPLLDELKAIMDIKWKSKPTIMIDDGKYFLPDFWKTARSKPYNKSQWPTFEQIEAALPGFGIIKFMVRGKPKILIAR